MNIKNKNSSTENVVSSNVHKVEIMLDRENQGKSCTRCKKGWKKAPIEYSKSD